MKLHATIRAGTRVPPKKPKEESVWKVGDSMPITKHAAFSARYETEATPNGRRYTFFCGLSERAVHTTDPIRAADEDAALAIAKREAKGYFNFCWECGVWIGDSACNTDEMKCVICAPFTTPPNYCAECGSPIKSGSNKCTRCGFKGISAKQQIHAINREDLGYGK